MTGSTLARALAALGAGLACVAAWAADPPPTKPDDADALSLADQAEPAKQAASPWRVFGEAALGRTVLRDSAGGGSVADGRLSIDLRYDTTLAPSWRAVLSDRLDATRSEQRPHQDNVNTLREAFVSWQPRPDAALDLGRVNVRHGSAYGYNPTDFFKSGALRSIVSLDPASLRENRQGTFLAQAQHLWSSGGVSAAWAPRLTRDGPSDAAASLDLGATNRRQRWLVAANHKFADAFDPQVLVFGGDDGAPTHVGLNLTGLLGQATVLFGEVSSGRDSALTSRAIGQPAAERRQHRAALGFTHTTAFNLALTVEAEHNSAAPDRAQWNAFAAGVPFNALRYLAYAELEQELPTRRALFVHARWQNAFTPQLDLSGFVRHDAETSSQTRWLEARYRWRKDMELALQWLAFSGNRTSIYGSLPQAHTVIVSARLYL